MGFHYELLKSFADYIGINMEIITENDIDKSFEMLNSGEADLMAVDLTINSSRRKQIRFSEPISQTRQVLVQRKPNRWSSMTIDEIEKSLIRNQLNLAGKTVYIQVSSSARECLKNLEDEIGDTIGIMEVPYETEELIALVARREIDYAVCDENIAIVNCGILPYNRCWYSCQFLSESGLGIKKREIG